jgi:hypothetical protein
VIRVFACSINLLKELGEDKMNFCELGGANVIPEPRATADLEEIAPTPNDAGWHARCLRSLAHQLTVRNDFYYVLLSAAEIIVGKE